MRLFFLGALIVVLEWTCARWFPAHSRDLRDSSGFWRETAIAALALGAFLSRRTTNLLPLLPLSLFLGVAGVFLLGRPFGDDYFGPDEIVEDTILTTRLTVLLAMPLAFVGLGQEIGRALARSSDRVLGLRNLVGGLATGFAVTTLATYLERTPPHWFGPIIVLTAGLMWFRAEPIRRWVRVVATLMLLLTGFLCLRTTPWWIGADDTRFVWTGTVRHDVSTDGAEVSTFLQGKMRLFGPFRDEPAVSEAIPFILRDELAANLPPVRRVLVIHSFYGDALRTPLKQLGADAIVDVVERERFTEDFVRANDPVGRFSDPRVRTHVADWRSFLHRQAVREPKTYDLILFGSCNSPNGKPLTRETVRDLADCLKPDGWLAFGADNGRHWNLVRDRAALIEGFGAEPLVLTHPPVRRIRIERDFDPWRDSAEVATQPMVLAGRKAGMSLLHAKFDFVAREQSIWIPLGPQARDTDYFLTRLPAEEEPPVRIDQWRETAVSDPPDDGSLWPLTEDWPNRNFPNGYELGYPPIRLALLLVPFAAIILALRVRQRTRSIVEMSAFWFGAAMTVVVLRSARFAVPMLGDDASAAQLAFLLVCLMLTLGIAVAVKWGKLTGRAVWMVFAASLVLNLLVPLRRLAELPEGARIAATLLLLFAPILTGGMLLAKRLPDSDDPANWAGSFCLGLTSGFVFIVLSVMFGFHALIAVSLVLFALSSLSVRSTNASGVVKL